MRAEINCSEFFSKGAECPETAINRDPCAVADLAGGWGRNRTMDARAADEIFRYEGFHLDRRGGGLFQADESGVPAPVTIGSRALDLLYLLVRRHGDLVSKNEIMTAVWPGMIVADSNLPTQIWALRRVLDHGRMQGSCIQTVAGRGYRFVAEGDALRGGGAAGQSLDFVRRRNPPTCRRAPAVARRAAV